jgi:tetratricopeptide (TPR) repeat protein
MKKLIVFLVGVLVSGLILGFALDRKGQYAHERALWLIQREFQKLVHHRESIPDYSFENIVAKYDRFAREHSTSPLAPKALLLKGEVYLFKTDYKKAREIFAGVAQKYDYNAEVVAQALVFTARAYEAERDWKNANETYAKVTKEYPLTTAGFSVPAYLGYYYLSHGKKKEADQAFEDAVMFYQNVANYYPNSPLEYTALRMVSECRIAQKRWEDALIATRAWMFKYPSSIMLFEAIKTIKDVCVGELKEYDCAIDTYKQFLTRNPEHPVRPILQKIIGNLENLKAKTTARHNEK